MVYIYTYFMYILYIQYSVCCGCPLASLSLSLSPFSHPVCSKPRTLWLAVLCLIAISGAPCLLRKLTSTSLCVFPYGCDWLVPAREGVAVRCDLPIIYLIFENTTGNDTRTSDLSFPQSALYGMPIHAKRLTLSRLIE